MISDLRTLIARMSPELDPTEYVFVCADAKQASSVSNPPLLWFQEKEGVTLVLPRGEAEGAGLHFRYPCRRITLTVHSDLTAVGFLAALCRALAEAGISVNAASAFHHDHLFVPSDRATDALRVLEDLAVSSFG